MSGASLKPSEMVAGGLRLNNANGLIREARFVVWDYDGKAGGRSTLAARFNIVTDDGVENQQYYSAGDPANFSPSADGRTVVALAGKAQLNDNTNFAILIKNLVQCGFPENRIEDDLAVFEGTYAFFQAIPAPERQGLERQPRTDANGRNQPATIIVTTQIHNLPWEAAKSPAVAGPQAAVAGAPVAAVAKAPVGAPAAVASPAPTTPAASAAPVPVASSPVSEEANAEAITFLMDVLGEKQQVTRAELTGLVFTKKAASPHRNEIAKLVFSTDFLNQVVAMGIATVQGDVISRVG